MYHLPAGVILAASSFPLRQRSPTVRGQTPSCYAASLMERYAAVSCFNGLTPFRILRFLCSMGASVLHGCGPCPLPGCSLSSPRYPCRPRRRGLCPSAQRGRSRPAGRPRLPRFIGVPEHFSPFPYYTIFSIIFQSLHPKKVYYFCGRQKKRGGIPSTGPVP